VPSLLLDEAFSSVTPFVDNAVSELLREFASLDDDRMLELLLPVNVPVKEFLKSISI